MKKEVMIRTVGGKLINLLDFKESDINVWDILWGLSNTNRFNGQTYPAWDVLSHSALVATLFRLEHTNIVDGKLELKAGIDKTWYDNTVMLCLLHDAAEAYVGDMIKPLKDLSWLVEDNDVFSFYFEQLEMTILGKILTRFGIPHHRTTWETVDLYDKQALAVEFYYLHPDLRQEANFGETKNEDHVPGFVLPFDSSIITTLQLAQPEAIANALRTYAVAHEVTNIDELFALPSFLSYGEPTNE